MAALVKHSRRHCRPHRHQRQKAHQVPSQACPLRCQWQPAPGTSSAFSSASYPTSQASASESSSSASFVVPFSDVREATIGDLLGLSQRTVLRIFWNTEKKESISLHTGLGPMPLYPTREEAQKRHQKFGSNPLGTVHFGPGIDGVERIKDSTLESGSGVHPCEKDAGISSSMRLSDFYAYCAEKKGVELQFGKSNVVLDLCGPQLSHDEKIKIPGVSQVILSHSFAKRPQPHCVSNGGVFNYEKFVAFFRSVDCPELEEIQVPQGLFPERVSETFREDIRSVLGADETCPPMVKVRKGNVTWFVIDRGILPYSPGYSLSVLCKGGGAPGKKMGLSVDFGTSGLTGPFLEFFCPQGRGAPDVFLAHEKPVVPSAYEREIRIPGSSETFQERVTFRPIFSGGTWHAELLDQLYHAFRENLTAEAVSICSGSGKIIRGYPSTLDACAESPHPYLKKHPGFYVWTLEQGNRWLDLEKKQARPPSLLESVLKAMMNNLVGYEIDVCWGSETCPGDIVHVGPMYLDCEGHIVTSNLSANVFTRACFEIAGQYYKGITSD